MQTISPAQALAQRVAAIPKPTLSPRRNKTAPDQIHRMIEVDRETLLAALNEAIPTTPKALAALGTAADFLKHLRASVERSDKPAPMLDRKTVDKLLDILKPEPIQPQNSDETNSDETNSDETPST